MSSLILGTANFGSLYGVTCNSQLNSLICSELLQIALAYGVNRLDTCHTYLNSESIIGSNNSSSPFRVDTKLPAYPTNCEFSPFEFYLKSVISSLKRLRVSSVSTLYVHQSSELSSPHRSQLIEFLAYAKLHQLCESIGFSIYSPLDLLLIDSSIVDVIQLPGNLYNQSSLLLAPFIKSSFCKASLLHCLLNW